MKLELDGGFYVAKSIVAGAQRCWNLYPEKNQPDAPFPVTTYLTPGITTLASGPVGIWRCLYTASTGDLYGVLGSTVYYIDSGWNLTALGTIDAGNFPVSMSDNRSVILIVDATVRGYYIDLTNNRAFGQISAPAFLGGDFVNYIDTFFVLNQPHTANFYYSASNLTVALLVGGMPTAGTIVGGSGYSNGLHQSVPLTGGSGVGLTADITVTTNAVAQVVIDQTTITAPYQIGDVLSAPAVDLGGGIATQGIIAGTGYTAGTYTGVPLTGGTGSGAVATIVIMGGGVTTVTLTNPGLGYSIGDALTAATSNLGNTGSGFFLNVVTVNNTGVGFTYTVTAVQSGTLAFNGLDIEAKSGASDSLVLAAVIHDEIWLIGEKTTEVWVDSGQTDFAFQRLAGVFLQHGCAARYSIAQADLSLFWLGLDPQGRCVVFRGTEYSAKRISTHAIENVIQSYAVYNDAIGFTYQIEGHVFYVLTFPSGDHTWVYDMATDLWHEWGWTDPNGLEHRHRANCYAFAYGVGVVGDWQNGQLYKVDVTNQTDAGAPIVRRRGFPQIIDDGRRLSFDQFVAQMDVGTIPLTGSGTDDILLAVDLMGDTLAVVGYTSLLAVPGSGPPKVSLRWSDDKGRSWSNPVEMSIGGTGDGLTDMQRRQLGMARYRVFELFWSGSYPTALNGAFCIATPAET